MARYKFYIVLYCIVLYINAHCTHTDIQTDTHTHTNNKDQEEWNL